MNEETVKLAIYLFIRKIIKYPHAHICKHYVAIELLSLLESLDYTLDSQLVDAIISGDDTCTLALLE